MPGFARRCRTLHDLRKGVAPRGFARRNEGLCAGLRARVTGAHVTRVRGRVHACGRGAARRVGLCAGKSAGFASELFMAMHCRALHDRQSGEI